MRKRSKRTSTDDIDTDTDTYSTNSHTITHSGATLPNISYAWTISGFIAYFNALCHFLLNYLEHFGKIREDLNMGLTDWIYSRTPAGVSSKTGPEAEMVPLKRGEEGVKVKRRRHQIGTKNGARVGDEMVYYPGMVNLSGTLCYMNSVLQAFASVTSLLSHLERVVNLAVDVDLPTPVTDALLEILYDLNTPQKRQPPALRPIALLHALQTLPAIRRLLSTREQQDAHELFLVLAEAVSDEAVKVAAEIALSRGFGEILTLQGYLFGKQANGGKVVLELGKIGQDGGKKTRAKKRGLAMPWEGLMARRRVCKRCGWCESVRMDTLGGMELAIPQSGDVTVEDCIAQYLAPELLSEVTCEMCSLRETHHHYAQDSLRLASPVSSISSSIKTSDMSTKSGSFSALENVKANTNGIESPSSMTSSRKKRGKEVKKVEIRLKEMLDSNTVTNFGESLLAPMGGNGPISVKWQTVRTDSIREAAITRAPQSLRLHFIRSEYTPYGQLLKKNARVNFPLILDLTRFVANGVWEERNIMGMLSTPKSNGDGKPSPSVESQAQAPQSRVLYRLESVILHYGYTHSSGHYICIRRKPAAKSGSGRATTTAIDNDDDDNHHRPTAITKSCPDGCRCDDCCWYGQVRSSGKEERGKGWLRISDADVDEVGIEALIEARSAVFMVFYEKVGEYVGDKVVKRGYTVNGSVKDIEKGSEGDSRESSVSVE